MPEGLIPESGSEPDLSGTPLPLRVARRKRRRATGPVGATERTGRMAPEPASSARGGSDDGRCRPRDVPRFRTPAGSAVLRLTAEQQSVCGSNNVGEQDDWEGNKRRYAHRLKGKLQ